MPSRPSDHRPVFRLRLVLFLLALAFGVAPAAPAREVSPFDLAVTAAVGARDAEVGALAAQLNALLPDPAKAAAADSARDPGLAKAFRVFHGFLMGPGKAMVAAVPVATERAMADGFFAGFFAPEDNPPDLVALVQGVANRVAARLNRPVPVKVGILGGGGIMAFARGGEWLVLSDEMARWPVDELAAVVAHEVGHLAKRDYVMIKVAAEVLRRVRESQPPAAQEAWKSLATFFAARYQRFSEYETDILAVDLLRRGGYEPQAMLRLMERLGEATLDPRSYLRADHPSTTERAAAIRRRLDALR